MATRKGVRGFPDSPLQVSPQAPLHLHQEIVVRLSPASPLIVTAPKAGTQPFIGRPQVAELQ